MFFHKISLEMCQFTEIPVTSLTASHLPGLEKHPRSELFRETVVPRHHEGSIEDPLKPP